MQKCRGFTRFEDIKDIKLDSEQQNNDINYDKQSFWPLYMFHIFLHSSVDTTQHLVRLYNKHIPRVTRISKRPIEKT